MCEKVVGRLAVRIFLLKKKLLEPEVSPDRIHTDKSLTGINRNRPGLDQALAAVRKGDSIVFIAISFALAMSSLIL